MGIFQVRLFVYTTHLHHLQLNLTECFTSKSQRQKNVYRMAILSVSRSKHEQFWTFLVYIRATKNSSWEVGNLRRTQQQQKTTAKIKMAMGHKNKKWERATWISRIVSNTFVNSACMLAICIIFLIIVVVAVAIIHIRFVAPRSAFISATLLTRKRRFMVFPMFTPKSLPVWLRFGVFPFGYTLHTHIID